MKKEIVSSTVKPKLADKIRKRAKQQELSTSKVIENVLIKEFGE